MVKFTTEILRFQKKGEKTGWYYIDIPSAIAEKIKPGTKKSYRVKGTLDNHSIKAVSLVPMGEGDFILAINADMRKALKKSEGDNLSVHIQEDKDPLEMDADLMACLNEDLEALQQFDSLTPGHRNYFSKWIESAKTEPTKAKRIAMTIDALLKKWDYNEMIRANKGK
ncbi:MAG: YdeI/OmpD-associated family protein [Bacteroidetes bacterium]|nr:YdeI/OmpD-associated family protein [Bacteroidota bacterium]